MTMLSPPLCDGRVAHARPRGFWKSVATTLKLDHSCILPLANRCSPRETRQKSDAPSANPVRHYHGGQQYSVTALTDSLGAIQERYAYDAYGGLSIFDAAGTARTTTAEGNRYTYTGREYDDVLDLYHYRARMYDPLCGRFLSRDPFSHDIPDAFQYINYLTDLAIQIAHSQNSHSAFWNKPKGLIRANSVDIFEAAVPIVSQPFLYALGAPTSHVDPTGNLPFCTCGCVPPAPVGVPFPIPAPWWVPPASPGIRVCCATCGGPKCKLLVPCAPIPPFVTWGRGAPCCKTAFYVFYKSTMAWALTAMGPDNCP
ncbi:MAG: hypothetical protein F9B45_32320 [Phycisphaera sp. RhM]|nr:hypothetical protein [Phycisphaera sp. RhM]